MHMTSALALRVLHERYACICIQGLRRLAAAPSLRRLTYLLTCLLTYLLTYLQVRGRLAAAPSLRRRRHVDRVVH